MGCTWGSTQNTQQQRKYHRTDEPCCYGSWKKLCLRDKLHLQITHLATISIPVAVSPPYKLTERQKPLSGTRNNYQWWFIYHFLGDSLEYSTYFCILITQNVEIHPLNPYTKQGDNSFITPPTYHQWTFSIFLCLDNDLPPDYFHRKYKQHFFSPGTCKLKRLSGNSVKHLRHHK